MHTPADHHFNLLDELASLRNENERLQKAARHLDDMLLRFAFDAGAIGEERISSLGIDVWGTLGDFRRAFGLPPTMTPEEWSKQQYEKDLEEEKSDGE